MEGINSTHMPSSHTDPLGTGLLLGSNAGASVSSPGDQMSTDLRTLQVSAKDIPKAKG